MAGGDFKGIRSATIELEWLGTPHVEIHPGEHARLDFRITNRGAVRSISDVKVEGEAAAWCRIERGDAGRQLFRDQFDSASLLVAIPRDATPSHNDLRLVARAESDANWIDFSFKVLESIEKPPEPPVVAFQPPTARLRPGTTSDVTLTIQNPEDEEVEYTVTVTGLDQSWDGAVRPLLVLGPGARDSTNLLLPPAEDVAPGQHVVTAIISRKDAPEINAPAHCSVEVPAPDGTTVAAGPAPKPARPPAVTVTPNPLTLTPGQSEAQMTITVTNLSELHEVYRLSTVGPPDWCRLETAEIALAPGESKTVQLTVAPFVSKDYASGQHKIRIGVAPLNLPRAAQIRVINVIVPKQFRFDLAAEPPVLSGRKEHIKVRVANTGTAEVDLKLLPQFVGRSCDVRLPQVIHLDLDERRMLTGVVGAHRNGLLGRRAEYQFQIAATAQGLDPPLQKVSNEIRFIHEPFMTHRFAGLVLLFAFLFTAIVVLFRIGPAHAFDSTKDAIECRLDDTTADPTGGPDKVKPNCMPEADAQ